jgi:hypothetical protein
MGCAWNAPPAAIPNAIVDIQDVRIHCAQDTHGMGFHGLYTQRSNIQASQPTRFNGSIMAAPLAN